MAYNLFCRGYFNSIAIDNQNEYQLDIFKKDYDGDPINITFGANPVIHQWQDDDPQKPIKGSSITISIINEGNISLDDFYSNEDNTFQVILYKIDFAEELIFKGFVSQDDCSEILVDYNHEIQITATDNLGILKDFTFDQASVKFGQDILETGLDIQTVTNGVLNYIKVNESYSGDYTKILAGSKISISGGTYFDGVYTVLNIEPDLTLGFIIQVSESVGGNSPSTLCNLGFTIPYDISSFLSIKEILRLCILSTGIELEELRVLSRIKPYGKDRWIDDTYIDCNSYLKNNTQYENCYSILEDLMKRFKASLFQAYGFWYIVRIGEYSMCNDYTTDTQFVHRYDATSDTYEYINSGLENRNLFIDINMAENGILKSLLRPYNYIKEKFDYSFKDNLLKNGDLTILGDLIGSYSSGLPGTGTIYYYTAPYWEINTDISRPSSTVQIVVDTDQFGNEIERYLEIKFSGTPSATIAQQESYLITNKIAVKKGDVIKVSFDYEEGWFAADGTNYSKTFYHYIQAQDLSVQKVNFDRGYGYPNNGTWTPDGMALLNLSEGTLPNLKTFTYTTDPAPIDGEFNFALNVLGSDDLAYTTQYKNLSVQIISTQIGKSIIGHTHKTICNLNIKNNSEEDIALDFSPSQAINGTLFTDEGYGVIRNIAELWDYEGTCETEYVDLAIVSGVEHPVTGWFGIMLTVPTPDGLSWENYPTGTQFIISGGTPIDGTYNVDFMSSFLGVFYIMALTEITTWWAGEATFTFNKPFQALKLGQHTTFEQMYLRWKTRPKLDLNILSVMGNGSNFFGPLHLIKHYAIQDIIFFLGSISINYRNDSAECTLYGLVNETEKRNDLEAVSSYEFDYIYKNA